MQPSVRRADVVSNGQNVKSFSPRLNCCSSKRYPHPRPRPDRGIKPHSERMASRRWSTGPARKSPFGHPRLTVNLTCRLELMRAKILTHWPSERHESMHLAKLGPQLFRPLANEGANRACLSHRGPQDPPLLDMAFAGECRRGQCVPRTWSPEQMQGKKSTRP